MFVDYRGTEGDISQEVEFTPYPEPNLSLGCGVSIWYFWQFHPLIAPLLKGSLQKVWH